MFHSNYEDKYIFASKYIYDNYDKIIENENIKKYIIDSKKLIDKYQNIWIHCEYKQVVSNYIALNLFILNNYI